jgi:hypothetical protein
MDAHMQGIFYPVESVLGAWKVNQAEGKKF